MATQVTGPSTDERDRRWRRVRELMAEQAIDLLLVFPQWMAADALYLAAQPGAIVFPLDGEPSIIIGGEDSPRAARREGWIADRRPANATGSPRAAFGSAVAQRLRETERDWSRQRVAIAGLEGHTYANIRQPEGYVNYTTLARVLEAMPGAEIIDGTPILAEARYVKSEREIDVLRQAVEIAEASEQALINHIQRGRSQAEVYGRMLLEQICRHASEPLVAWCPGEWGAPKHRFTNPPPGDIADGLHLCTEIFPSVRGYNAQIASALFVGDPPTEALEAVEIGRLAFERALELMRPGATWGEVEAGVQEVTHGTRFTIDFLVHGRGLGQDGPLIIPTDTHSHVQHEVIRANTAFVLKPGAFPSANDPARSHDVRWGDSVVIRDNGAERLGMRPYRLLVV